MLNFPEVDVDLIDFVQIQDQFMHHPTSCFHSEDESVVVSVAANHCCVICKIHILVGIPDQSNTSREGWKHNWICT